MLYSTATAVVFLVTLGLSNAAFAQSPNLVALGGLFQRIMIVAAWSWLTLLAWATYRNRQRSWQSTVDARLPGSAPAQQRTDLRRSNSSTPG